jgi:hypothetical protein
MDMGDKRDDRRDRLLSVFKSNQLHAIAIKRNSAVEQDFRCDLPQTEFKENAKLLEKDTIDASHLNPMGL